MPRPPELMDSHRAGDAGSRLKAHGLALMPKRMAQTRGSSPLSTTQPWGLVTVVTIALTSASWSRVSMPCRPRWSALTLVTTLTSLAVTPMPLRSMPPRAVSRMPMSRPGVSRTPRAPAGPEKSPSSFVSPMTTTPSVELQAVVRPAAMHMWAMSRVVVVLPLVPVTDATGTRGVMTLGPGPSGAAMMTAAASSMTASARRDGSSSPAMTAPTCSPATRPRVRCTHGKASTTSSTV